jgi:Reverse transcriptase (RNA-dependent DNA polymerase)
MIYDVKHDGRHKARLVAEGHMMEVSTDSVYSGVVSLRGVQLMIYLAKLNQLNQLELWGDDVGNAYLEALTKEKVYNIGGPETGDLTGHALLNFSALYGLKSSGLCWHQRFADVLRFMGFLQSIAESDNWMRENDGLYEYIAVYVDDLLIAARDPREITRAADSSS